MRFINEETLNIYFRDDVWTNRYVRTHIGETLRTVNFSGIRDPELRLEAKSSQPACSGLSAGPRRRSH
jgi:hypothetical protein